MDEPVKTSNEKYKPGIGFTMALSSKAETIESLPPLSSSRLPMMNSVSLANNNNHLNPVTRYNTVPKRYEDTKPVFIQNFTHRKIIDIGDDLHNRNCEIKDKERVLAVSEAEQRVWAQAELIKEAAIKKNEEKLKIEHEKAIKRIQKENQKAIKEEALRVEGVMQQLALEQVKQEREEGEIRLKETVAQRERELRKEKQEALNKSIREERDVAAKEAAKMAKYHKEVLEKAIKKADEEKEKELEFLRNQKDLERHQAIIAVRTYEQQVAKDNLHQVRAVYEQQVEVLKDSIAELSRHLEVMSIQLNQADIERAKAQKEYHIIRDAFMDYINKSNNFVPPEADYLLPSSTVPTVSLES
ncbi:uncharacterized protein C6orf163 homolog [Tubulanus polymorphus]|uniref:uncharacterized protein C6orf163 homolog n=1 Tax=Tubulanus polymorphus TaxID=672921 RepID=UPI003DA5D596